MSNKNSGSNDARPSDGVDNTAGGVLGDYDELREAAEFDAELNPRSDVYQCTCGFSFISIATPRYCPGCGGDEFRA
jgi:rubrerythrin